jgi:cytochrome b
MANDTNKIKVWDGFVRLFHWSLVICVVANLLNEAGDAPHRYLGYVATTLVVCRIVWGFTGSRHARFNDWVPSPRTLWHYLQNLRRGVHWHKPGHNPAAAVMMLALMLVVLGLAGSGWLASTDRFFGEEWLEELHEALAGGLQLMLMLHVFAAITESWQQGQNLILSMLTGYKQQTGKQQDADITG